MSNLQVGNCQAACKHVVGASHFVSGSPPPTYRHLFLCRRNDRGVRIVANSYGCSAANINFCYSAQFEKAIRAFRDQGGLFIVSAGNSGTNNDKVHC